MLVFFNKKKENQKDLFNALVLVLTYTDNNNEKEKKKEGEHHNLIISFFPRVSPTVNSEKLRLTSHKNFDQQSL